MPTLRKYQRIGVRKIEKFGGRALLADEPGLGKTCQSIRWARDYARRMRPVVVVCPANLKWNWRAEIRMWSKRHKVRILSSRTPPRRPPTFKERVTDTFYVINYDVLPWWVDWIRQLNAPTLIGDEVHYIKNRKAKRSKAFKQLSRGMPNLIALSGTPLTNKPAELWPILNMLRPKAFPNFFEFCLEYAQPKRTYWGWDFSGARNLDVLHATLKKTCMIRRKKENVLKELPAKTRRIIPVDLAPAAAREYDKANKDFMRWLIGVSPGMAAKAKRMSGLSKMTALTMLAARLKLPAVETWIEDFLEESDGKLIVFGIHHCVLEPLHEKFKACSVLIDGNVTGRRKQELTDKFREMKRYRVFFGNIQAAGAGWNGQVASNVLFAEIGWTPGEMGQCEDRIHRIGQTKGAMCHYMVAKGTIEHKLCQIVQAKSQILDQTLDGAVRQDGLDIYDRLLQSFKQGVK